MYFHEVLFKLKTSSSIGKTENLKLMLEIKKSSQHDCIFKNIFLSEKSVAYTVAAHLRAAALSKVRTFSFKVTVHRLVF